ncbi:bacillithiol system redox-active protein YtxJ [Algoriphagus aestuariicola]|jgi:bacillithiol system protein YtxJ|uniref:Bacillithiol system redox-active protein YtxJ n=1 Tax=Algoriphagus aestuariicola TaxID=1852016 RepID=A0ABS3BS39_9BACT|nr:bacillithiol system redox-active protein YtxJ [Algoriphagus aestuariicola]MBN7802046.1 bacillithiol system redox-active protein YtxJ [Algoriphagus aestuariicola]
MNWKKLTESTQIEEIKALSTSKPVLIFKHSTRCSVSSMSLDRLLRNWKTEDGERVVPYFLDLIAFRSLSNQIEAEFGVPHESPQVIIVRNGRAVYDNSHFGISYPEIMAQV